MADQVAADEGATAQVDNHEDLSPSVDRDSRICDVGTPADSFTSVNATSSDLSDSCVPGNADDFASDPLHNVDPGFIQCKDINTSTLEAALKNQILECMASLGSITGIMNENGEQITDTASACVNKDKFEETNQITSSCDEIVQIFLRCCDKLICRAVDHAEYLSQKDVITRDNIIARLQSVLKDIRSHIEFAQSGQPSAIKKIILEALDNVIQVICCQAEVHALLSSYRSSSRHFPFIATMSSAEAETSRRATLDAAL